MSDYIDREAVMQKFADHVKRSNNSDFASVPTWNQAVQIVEDYPAADVAPVAHGKWLDKLLTLEYSSLEVSRNINGKIVVHYFDGYIDDGVCLIGASGRGSTIEEACEDYYRQISGKKLVFNAFGDCRKVVHVL